MKAENYERINGLMKDRNDLADRLKLLEDILDDLTSETTRNPSINIDGTFSVINISSSDDMCYVHKFLDLLIGATKERIRLIDNQLKNL
jgi:hypothetical protein